MEAIIQSLVLVFVGEMGDKTQLLSLLLVARYGKPWTILAGVLVATILNHALASSIGVWVAGLVEPLTLKWILGLTFIAFGLWVLIPDKEDEPQEVRNFGLFVKTVVAFFIAEMGDKTQLATVALGARFADIYAVTIGSTLGMLGANALAIFLGRKILEKIPMQWVRRFAALLFGIFGVAIILS